MNSEAIDEQLRKLREDLARLHGDLGQFARVVAEPGKAEAVAAVHDVRDRLRTAAHKMADMTRTGQQGIESATKQLSEHPLIAVAAAFGLGFAMGKLLGRS